MSTDRIGAVAVAAGSLLLLAGILWHPFIPDLRDNADVVHHLTSDTTTWFGAHLLVAIASALVLIGFLAVRAHVRSTVGRESWTGRAIAPLVLGTILFTMLPAMEIGMLAVHEAGGDVLATHNELDTWLMPILFAGSALFAIGSILFAIGVQRARILPGPMAVVVMVAFLVSALSRFAPFTLSLRIGIIALNIAMVPLAVTMWKAGGATGSPGSSPAGRVSR